MLPPMVPSGAGVTFGQPGFHGGDTAALSRLGKFPFIASQPISVGMELAPVSRGDRAGRQRALEGLEIGAPALRLLDREDIDRREVAVALEGFDLGRAQPAHVQLPVPVALASGPHFADSEARNSANPCGPGLRGIW